ncbi:SurA N-terminal domain-containing protein [Anaerococcus ihuae]|uniref:SurA N-terminal domain-containing protein n=1 Tax=Anaerococcus ihuae TaxID=2899519 RepID=UPI001F376147|nr:SurA N-terminal domain-containing protein [Anaerococcus ihuae]
MKNKKKIAILIISVFCIFLTSCSKKFDKDKYVAVVDDEGISKELFEKELSYYQKYYIKKYGDNFLEEKSKKGNSNYKKLESELLDSIVMDQVMVNDLKKNNVKVTKNDSKEAIDKLSEKISSKDSLLENVKTFGVSEDEFDEITYQDSIRKKHFDYFLNNNNVKDTEVLKYFEENKNLQKKYKYDCLIFDDKNEAIKVRESIKNSEDFKNKMKSRIRNYDVYRSDFVYKDDALLKKSSLSKVNIVGNVFKFKDSYIIFMINSENKNKKNLLLDAKEIYLENEYNKYLEKLIKNSNIKLFI